MRRILTFFLILTLGLTSGCYNIRKKFIRKKKGQEDRPVYIDFKDYPLTPSREAYIDYYLFVRGWLDELAEALNKGLSYKRERRAINEAIMNFEQIIAFFNSAGKDRVYPLYEELLKVREELARSPNMSEIRRNLLIRKIETFKRRFEKECNYTDAEEWMG